MSLAEIGAVPCSAQPTSPLAAVLHWCNEHPHHGDEPPWGDLWLTRHNDGAVTVHGHIPDAIAISFGLLDTDADRIRWDHDALVLDVTPEPLRYQPVYADWLHRYIICRRVPPR